MELDIDLYSPEIIQDPWDAVTEMRAAGPVVRHSGTGAWILTTDKLARLALTDTSRFTIEGSASVERFGPEAFLVIDDKARHDQLRSIWMAAFARGNLEAMRPMITQLADEMIDPMEDRLRAGEVVDAENSLCRDLPAYVIAHMMGISPEYRPDVVRWSDALGAAAVLHPSADRATHPVWIAARTAREEIGEYLTEAIAYRRKNPGSDLISQIVHSPHNLPDNVIVANSRQMLYAGNETTAKWLGHILVVLAERPDVRQEVVDNPKLVTPAQEEVMRMRPVVMSSYRRVHGGDAVIEGVTVPEGKIVLPMVCCANRDPVRFEDPDTFNIHRKFVPNLGFGFGMHSCLGMTLARLETEIVINRILARIPNYEIAGEVLYNAFTLRGPKKLPIALS